MSDRQAYIEKMEAQLKIWDAQISQWNARADKNKADLKIEYNKNLERLKSKRDELNGKIQDIKRSSGDAWQRIKEGSDRIMSEMKTTVDDVKSKFG
jgi:uncharacterized coiled-coil DUF342 family protein